MKLYLVTIVTEDGTETYSVSAQTMRGAIISALSSLPDGMETKREIVSVNAIGVSYFHSRAPLLSKQAKQIARLEAIISEIDR